MQTRLLHRDTTGSVRPGQQLVVSARVRRPDKLLFDFSDLPVRRNEEHFALFIFSTLNFSDLLHHQWAAFSFLNILDGLFHALIGSSAELEHERSHQSAALHRGVCPAHRGWTRP